MPLIMPIKDLRNTTKISNIAHKEQEPIFITKNGYSDLVVMSSELYDKFARMNRIDQAIFESEQEIANGAEAVDAERERNELEFDPEKRHLFQIEIPNTMFTPYLYESQGIEIALSNSEIDTVFWNAAAPGVPTEGIQDFLGYLKNKGIRTGVISNISYAPSVVAERIHRLLPENAFEFIITSSNYIFRKPNKRIFDLALEKAELQPDEVWYIGDQYECDVKGALYAGLLPIWYIGAIDLPYTEDINILTVKKWNEIERYMEG